MVTVSNTVLPCGCATVAYIALRTRIVQHNVHQVHRCNSCSAAQSGGNSCAHMVHQSGILKFEMLRFAASLLSRDIAQSTPYSCIAPQPPVPYDHDGNGLLPGGLRDCILPGLHATHEGACSPPTDRLSQCQLGCASRPDHILPCCKGPCRVLVCPPHNCAEERRTFLL